MVGICNDDGLLTGGTESNTGYSSAGMTGDIVIALDLDNQNLFWSKMVHWQGSADPSIWNRIILFI